MVVRQMDNDIIDRSPTKGNHGNDLLLHDLVLGKDIARKGIGEAPDDLHCFIKCAPGDYGQNGTEDLFAHNWVIQHYIGQDGRFDLKAFATAVSAKGDARIGVAVVDELTYPIKMVLVDYMGVLIVVYNSGAVILMQPYIEFCYEFIAY